MPRLFANPHHAHSLTFTHSLTHASHLTSSQLTSAQLSSAQLSSAQLRSAQLISTTPNNACRDLPCVSHVFTRHHQSDCAELRLGWIARVLAFNLGCEVLFVGFWHWLTYASNFAKGIASAKFNPENQVSGRAGGRVDERMNE